MAIGIPRNLSLGVLFRGAGSKFWWPKWQTSVMRIEQWWPRLKPSTREWLVENNGDAVPPEMIVEITQAGGSVSSDAWWVGESRPSGFYFSDEGVDWIEAVGNGEVPEPR
ncbi:hypothetical protein [Arthrobacter sp. SO3]|uniref:hypothetical protein n=1 Tax=Arthrobacter sp. SO3 TaxID=1897057 RepID=UPI001CFF7E25|nr:hypothetical protein [Arthrobacter sp. SO3]